MIYTYQNKHPYYFFVALCIASFFPVVVTAQSALSLSVSPAIFDMNANPGQAWESSVRVVNNNSFDIEVYAEAVNFRPAGEDGSPRFIPVATTEAVNETFAEWIRVPRSSFAIPAEQTLEIPLIIDVPLDAPPGGHYAAILIGTRPPAGGDGTTQVETSQTVSSLFFLRVAGDIVEQGSIRSFRTVQSLVETPKVDFELRFENAGNVHLRPEGEITIYNMWGQERGVIPVNQKTLFGNILSDSIRTFRFGWEGEWSPVDIGRYRVEAVLAYGEEARKSTTAETTFWIVPWRILLGIIGVLTIIILLVAWLVKLYIRRMFAVAGMQQRTPLQKHLTEDARRSVSVVAPIEVGILDLRSRFSNHNTAWYTSLLQFVREYKLFFVAIVTILCIGYILFWFTSHVSDTNREFEITVNGSGQEVIVDSESLQYEETQSVTEEVPKRDAPPLQLVNRSGVSGTAAAIALDLEELGYTISGVSTDLHTESEQTVIVHDPSVSDAALDVSEVIGSPLLSPFETNTDTDTIEITVYIGKDLIK